MKQDLYIGTYTEPIVFGSGRLFEGKGRGIHHFSISRDGRMADHGVAVSTRNPSWLCLSPSMTILYCVNECKEFEGVEGGGVSSYATGPFGPRLYFLNSEPTGGGDPCHAVRVGGFLFVSNFSGASVSAFYIRENGSIGSLAHLLPHTGKGSDPVLQAGPHPHSVTASPDGRCLLVPDVGTDSIHVYTFDSVSGEITPDPGMDVACAPGSGPRLLAFHPYGRVGFVVNELNSTVSVLDVLGSEVYAPGCTRPTAAETEGNTASHLALSQDGRFLYLSNRGRDTLSVFSVDVINKTVDLIQTVSCGGRTPRQFALMPDGKMLVCANLDSDSLTSFAVREDGTLEQVGEIEAPSPAFVFPVPTSVR